MIYIFTSLFSGVKETCRIQPRISVWGQDDPYAIFDTQDERNDDPRIYDEEDITQWADRLGSGNAHLAHVGIPQSLPIIDTRPRLATQPTSLPGPLRTSSVPSVLRNIRFPKLTVLGELGRLRGQPPDADAVPAVHATPSVLSKACDFMKYFIVEYPACTLLGIGLSVALLGSIRIFIYHPTAGIAMLRDLVRVRRFDPARIDPVGLGFRKAFGDSLVTKELTATARWRPSLPFLWPSWVKQVFTGSMVDRLQPWPVR